MGKEEMERVNRIWNHPFYQECLGKIAKCEQDREFCRHTPEHFLDVARLTYIMALEQSINPAQNEISTQNRNLTQAMNPTQETNSTQSANLAQNANPTQNSNSEQSRIPDKEQIYAAALLHDIGRFRQYEEGIPHDEASVEIAAKLIPECGFTEEESAVITGMIASHRKKEDSDSLNALFYKADKLSRSCFACPAEKDCNWAAEKKNLLIKY